MGLLSVENNLKEFLKTKPVIRQRLLFLFWYMKPHWELLKKKLSIKSQPGYHWPLYEASDEQGPFSIVIIPGPGMGLMDILVRELSCLGAEKMLLWGNAAFISPVISLEARIFSTQAFASRQNTLTESREITILQAGKEASDSWTWKIFERFFSKPVPDMESRVAFGPLWTTLSPYTFSQAEYQKAKENSCLAVDMEAFAFFNALESGCRQGIAYFYARDYYDDSGWQANSLLARISSLGKKEFMQGMIQDIMIILRNF